MENEGQKLQAEFSVLVDRLVGHFGQKNTIKILRNTAGIMSVSAPKPTVTNVTTGKK